jgi:RNA ligase
MKFIDKGWTPLFEWCSYKQQIVVEYEKDMLILTGLRNNISGEYLTYKQLRDAGDKYSVPVTGLLNVEYSKDYSTAAQLLTRVKDAVDLEGYILAFENGEMYKMKCQWYVDRSKKVRKKKKNQKL